MYTKRRGVETQDLETDSDNPFVPGDDGYDVFLQNKKLRVGNLEPVQDFLLVGNCSLTSPLMVLAEHLCKCLLMRTTQDFSFGFMRP